MKMEESRLPGLEEAVALQERFRTLVTHVGPSVASFRHVAGLDVAYGKDGLRLAAAVVVLDASTLEVRSVVVHEDAPEFEYVPGLFSFREAPPLLAALERVDPQPDLLMCDGHGIAHPRRFGLACHVGVMTGIPAIGVAKRPLIGRYDEPEPLRGGSSPLIDDGEVIGRALRTADNVKPVFVSVGHRINLDDACEITLATTPKYRIPAPVRMADQVARRALDSGTR
jgi:deoxyribonuclease V